VRTIKRQAWLPLVAAAALAFVACGDDDSDGDGGGGGGGGTTEVVYSLPTPESLEFYAPIVADTLGFFEQEGVSAQLAPASEEIPSTAFLENGDADIAMADIDELIISTAQGGTLKAVFSPQHANTAGTVVPEDSEIQSFDQLAGRTVGLASEEDNASLEMQLIAAGMAEGDVETITVGTSGATIADTFEKGEIDAYVGAVSDFTALRANGVPLRIITPEDVQRIDGNPTAVTPETLQNKREAIVGFLRAWSMGQHVGLTKPDVVEAIVRERVSAEWRNEEVAKAALAQTIDLHTPDDEQRIGDLRPDVWETGQDLLQQAGIIEEKVDVSQILDGSLIEQINDFDRAQVEAAADEWMQQNR
jgi:ABC-type nitrate/sulfonate/bicarbonate transport system substrate-binding protein